MSVTIQFLLLSWVSVIIPGALITKLITTHKSEPLFLYNPIKLGTYYFKVLLEIADSDQRELPSITVCRTGSSTLAGKERVEFP